MLCFYPNPIRTCQATPPNRRRNYVPTSSVPHTHIILSPSPPSGPPPLLPPASLIPAVISMK